MNPQFLIAKLAANASDTAWSQAYSTLNFYVSLSVSSEQPTDEPLAQIGKELLERLQREYFSLDEKSLESIKQAVQTTVDSTKSDITYSLILVTNNAHTLYIVTAGEGSVAIKRNGKFGIIAQGKLNTVLSFSGPLKNHDLVVVQTSDFTKTIPASVLAQSLDSLNVTDISENLAPHLHSTASGGEAAIILLYTDPEVALSEDEDSKDQDSKEESTHKQEFPSEDSNTNDEKPKVLAADPVSDEKEETTPEKRFPLPSPTSFIATLTAKRKMLLGIVILLLIIGLIGSIFWKNREQKSAQNGEAIAQAIASAQAEYEEGEALEPLNRPLALEKYNTAQKTLVDTKNKFPNDSEIDKLNSLLTKVEQKLSEFSAGKKVENGKKLASASDLDLDEIRTVSIKGGTLFVTNKTNMLTTLTNDGKADETFETEASTIIDVSANDNFAFLLTNSGVLRVDLGSGNETELFDLDSARQLIDVFGSNVYLASASDKMVEKYAPSRYSASNYLTNKLPASPISMTIDGSVYVLYDNGKIGKFTRGADDSFNVTGLQGSIGKKSVIYTEEDFTHLYALDTGNQRLLMIAKNGEVKQEFSWDVFKNATDLAVDEANKTVYIATPSDLYSFTY